MFNTEKLADPSIKPVTTDVSLNGLDINDLLELRARIDALLPPKRLDEMDLEAEILTQYHQAKALLGKVLGDAGVPTNQKAQVANSCTTILDQLLKMQTKLYSAERIKSIEQALIKAVRTLPAETQEQFFTEYQRIYAEVANAP